MFTRKLFTLLLLLTAITTYSQKNFTYTPANPKAGDVITFTYEPAGDLANTILPVDAVVYQWGEKGYKADDITLTRIGNKFSGTIQTDATRNFLYLGFSADKKFDNNYNEGYYVLYNDNDAVKKGSYYNLNLFYQYYGSLVGVERNYEKALGALEKEFELYPEQKKKYLSTYISIMVQAKRPDYLTAAMKETENLLKAGLKEEADYEQLEGIYRSLKLPEQMKLITALKKEKFPDGRWTVNETISKFFAESDMQKKKQLLAEIVGKAESGDENWKNVKDNLATYKLQMAYAYATAKNWDEFKKAVKESGVTDKNSLASLYNNTAWEIQKTGENLALAEELSGFATMQAKEEKENPSTPKPDYSTTKQWKQNRDFTYAMYADTYGMIMYKKGNYKKGFPYAKEAAITINKGKSADENNTYVLLAEKVLPAKQYKKEIEQFIKDGKSTGEMKEILKKAYVKEKKSEAGFDDYIAALQKENYLKMLEELRKSMLNEAAPSFALLDLDGKKVNISDLKGKVVVVDFWATWCGPCKASFPGMQKMVNKYKEDPDVKFVFVDTWERVEDKPKNAADFIANNKYSFHVLLDNDSKVVEQFKVDGIPTKFVIDKNGNIRFKAIGFDGSDDKLVAELTAMIDIASGNMQKAF
jgi:thiol-disulfide isomerase/thioredoxin